MDKNKKRGRMVVWLKMGANKTEPACETLCEIYESINMGEGINLLDSWVVNAYLREGVTTKEMARRLFIPVPLATVIKNELTKHDFIKIKNGGIFLTKTGLGYVTDTCGYGPVNKEKLLLLLDSPEINTEMFENEIAVLEKIYKNRPEADVTVDQSLCTAETGIRRALLMLRTCGLIGKNVMFLGDDDLSSVAAALTLGSLGVAGLSFTVIDIDERVLIYINETAKTLGVQINTVESDIRGALPAGHQNAYDAVFTDPPYTVTGLELFLNRGAGCLKHEPGLYFYLSFARKKPEIRLETQRVITSAGLVIANIEDSFNRYLGAQILGGASDMYILTSTSETRSACESYYSKPIYTNEINRSVRKYLCKTCRTVYTVGNNSEFATIERLKENGCRKCGENTFIILERRIIV